MQGQAGPYRKASLQHNPIQYSDPPTIGSLQEFQRNSPPASLSRPLKLIQDCGLVRLGPGNMWLLYGERRLDPACDQTSAGRVAGSESSYSVCFDSCRMGLVLGR